MQWSGPGMTRREMLGAMLAGAMATGCAGRGREMNQPTKAALAELILCGAEEVFILSLAAGEETAPGKVWSWTAAECPDIPQAMKRSFRSTDDCKPVDSGRKILISSSSGAIALVDRQSKRALFHAEVINAHSVEMLPGGRLAAAASVNESPKANRVILFDIASGKELASDRLVSAHGVVWDGQRQVLWALGNDELRAYRIDDRQGNRMKMERQIRLPESNGHDLVAIPGNSRLFISTGTRCWHFDRDTGKIASHDALGDADKVKSYSVHPMTGRVAYVQAEGKNWWAERVHLLNPRGLLHLPGQRLYKARWVC